MRRAEQDEFLPAQFEMTQQMPRLTAKMVLCAVALLLAGSALLLSGALLLGGAIGPGSADDAAARGWPLVVIGALLLIPGAYHVRLAYKTYRGQRAPVYAELDDPDELDY